MKKKNIIPSIIVIILVLIPVYILNKTITFETAVCISANDVQKIGISDGNTGLYKETSDPVVIAELMNELSKQKFKKVWNSKPHTGWSYAVKIYPKNGSGYISYILNKGFAKVDGYTGECVDGDYSAVNYEQIDNILMLFYNNI